MLLRTELKELQKHIVDNKSDVQLNFNDFVTSFQELLLEYDNKEREIVQRLTVDHELEITDYKRVQEEQNCEMNRLKEENARLQHSLQKVAEENTAVKEKLEKVSEDYDCKVNELENRVKEVLDEKEKAVKEITDRLHESHKAEIESIRSRFKLMMCDRSPSETSLEKVDFKEDSSSKHTKAEIEEAVSQEMKRWQRKVEEIQIQHEIFVDDVRREISEEKEKQIVILQERVANLNLECIKHKNTIQQLAESDIQSQNSELLAKLDLLEKEKNELQMEVDRCKQQQPPQELVASVAVLEGTVYNDVELFQMNVPVIGKIDVATSPVKHKERLTKSQSPLRPCTVSLNSCNVGELVLVVWNPQHENYTIHQESKYMYFLHSDCMEPLGLTIAGSEQRKPYCIGEVVEKEYCHARKVNKDTDELICDNSEDEMV